MPGLGPQHSDNGTLTPRVAVRYHHCMTTQHSNKFEVGERYSCSSVCDSNCVWIYEVIRRTDKFVTLKDVDDGTIGRVKVHPYMGERAGTTIECCYPHGTYSMAAVLTAEKHVDEPELVHCMHQGHYDDGSGHVRDERCVDAWAVGTPGPYELELVAEWGA